MTRGRALAAVLVVVTLAAAGLVTRHLLDDGPKGSLVDALETLPGQTLVANFTDWQRVRAELDPSLLAAPSARAAEAFYDQAYNRDFSAASLLALDDATIRDAYGWSLFDAQWEMYGQSADGAVEVLRMSEGFDFGAANDALSDLGYAEADGDGVRAGGPDLVAQAAPGVTPQLANLALLADQDLIVASDSPTYLATALATISGDEDALLGADGVDTLVSGLDGLAVTAVLSTGSHACLASGFGAGDLEARKEAAARIKGSGGVHPVEGLGLGLTEQGDLVVAMAYADGNDASRDLDARRALASGDATGQGGIFEDRFTVASASVEGDAIVMRLHPPADDYQLLSDLGQGGLLFAAC